jgi:hypothetical protein
MNVHIHNSSIVLISLLIFFTNNVTTDSVRQYNSILFHGNCALRESKRNLGVSPNDARIVSLCYFVCGGIQNLILSSTFNRKYLNLNPSHRDSSFLFVLILLFLFYYWYIMWEQKCIRGPCMQTIKYTALILVHAPSDSALIFAVWYSIWNILTTLGIKVNINLVSHKNNNKWMYRKIKK